MPLWKNCQCLFHLGTSGLRQLLSSTLAPVCMPKHPTEQNRHQYDSLTILDMFSLNAHVLNPFEVVCGSHAT